ncbi:hypothetical protein RJT34_30320 [Clitoria ternatea]|uniref:Peptidase A1 domain-containing protein n=1 Tax=Clitoria ternatea TaxID=43366 RepID=A0AAN9EWS3_CLITE
MTFTTTKSQPLNSALIFRTTLYLIFFFFSSEGYTTHLIHIDSPLSPFHNPSNTHLHYLHNALQRSLKRINHFKSPLVPMNPSGGEYLMRISIGTPSVEVIGIADTGSDLTWTQCLPCIQCYNQTIPLFDPTHSSSYHKIPCTANSCNALGKSKKCRRNTTTCGYRYSYGDGSHTAGNLASETLILGPISLTNVTIGCGHDTAGIFDKAGSGIIGLGLGELSLVSQLGAQFPGSKKFSYCLIPTNTTTDHNSTSTISFGQNSVVPHGTDVVTFPLVKKARKNFYYVTLEAFSVGNKRVAFESESSKVEGNIVLDSGTTFMLLPTKVYNGLESAVSKEIKGEKRVKDPTGTGMFNLCYGGVDGNITLPVITANFKGGDVKLQAVNAFTWVREDLVCFAMISSGNVSVYGNMAQANFLIEYDLDASTVSFKPTDCTQHTA